MSYLQMLQTYSADAALDLLHVAFAAGCLNLLLLPVSHELLGCESCHVASGLAKSNRAVAHSTTLWGPCKRCSSWAVCSRQLSSYWLFSSQVCYTRLYAFLLQFVIKAALLLPALCLQTLLG